jgi:CRP/FNR family transcriptional regulator, cyclic AMP receptor protein
MPPNHIRLLDADPDLGQFMSPEAAADARELTAALMTFDRDDDGPLQARLEQQGAFAALVLEGMVVNQIQVADQAGLRLIAPGDFVWVNRASGSMRVSESACRAIPGTKLALLGHDLLLGIRRWPGLARGIQVRSAQQADRLAAQLVICQLPTVDERLLAMMWLLAESWGRVTSAGTALPLRLTHEVLGALIGARRPTVTLAFRDLTKRGAIIRQDQGWLLLASPPGASGRLANQPLPSLISAAPNEWAKPDDGLAASSLAVVDTIADLRLRIAELHDRHEEDKQTFNDRLTALQGMRERCTESRARVARDRLRRGRSRSS